MGCHGWIQRGQEVRTIPENHKLIGFPSNTGPDPLKITKLSSQHSMWAIIGPPAKHHLVVVVASLHSNNNNNNNNNK